MLASRPGDVTDPPPVELRGRVRRPRRAPGAHGAGRGGAGAVRGGGPGAGVPIVQAAALLPRAVVVGHDPAAGRRRVLARTRPSDAAGPRPRRRRDRLAAVWQHDGKLRSHAPDYFARRADGSAVVVDCQPLTRIKPRDAAAFETTRQACREVGWDYRLVCAPDPVLAANVRWLAGYRHPRNAQPEVTAALREAFTVPGALMDGAQQVGDPIAILPVLFHLLWSQVL